MTATREELARSVQLKININILETERDIIGAMQKVRAYESSVQFLKRNIMKGQISLRELDNVTPDQKVYRPLGRAFILREKEDIQKELDGIIKINETEIIEYEKSRIHFMKKKEELEKVFKDGLEKHKALAGY